MKKRVISLALAFALLLLALPAAPLALAEYGECTYSIGAFEIDITNAEPQTGNLDRIREGVAPYISYQSYDEMYINYFYLKAKSPCSMSYTFNGYKDLVRLISINTRTAGTILVDDDYNVASEIRHTFYNGHVLIYLVYKGFKTVDGQSMPELDCVVINVESTFFDAAAPAPSPSPSVKTAGADDKVIAAGTYASMAIKNDNSLWMWGWNGNGLLGDATGVNRDKPYKVMDNVAQVAAGYAHCLAIKTDGTLWAWGENEFGQLGDGTFIGRSTPVKIMDNVTALAAGTAHSLALKTDGTLWAWGCNEDGQVGDNSSIDRPSPVKVIDGVKAVAAGSYHSLAIKTDGSLWAWGWNLAGQLGDGTIINRYTPVKVADGVKSVTAGYNFSMAVKTDNSLWTWGLQNSGQLGDGVMVDEKYQPTPAKVMDDVAVAAASMASGFAVKTDGSLWVFGWNSRGQLGLGNTTDRATPVKLTDGVATVADGSYAEHTMFAKTDGSLWTCGWNEDSQLGDGSSVEYRTTPVKVMEDVILPDKDAPPPPPPDESDKPSGYAADRVNAAIAAGIVPSQLQSKYTADITRAEFCALAVAIYETHLGKTITERKTFPDTTDPNAEKMAALGVVTGGNAGFNPDGVFTREMAARLLVNLLEVMGIDLPKTPTTFNDQNLMANWAVVQIGQVQAAGLIGGTGSGGYNPQGKFTREAAMMLMLNLWDFLADPPAPEPPPPPQGTNSTFPIEFKAFGLPYSITGYSVGSNNGKMAITVYGEGFDSVSIGFGGIQVAVHCEAEAGGRKYSWSSASIGGGSLTIMFNESFIPEKITFINGDTGAVIISFNVKDVPQMK